MGKYGRLNFSTSHCSLSSEAPPPASRGLSRMEAVHRNHRAICLCDALIPAGMTCKDWGMSGRIHSQWHCSAASQSLHTTHPSKKCHPLWSLQRSRIPLPLRSLQLKRTTKPLKGRYRTRFFFLTVPPSVSLIVCLSFSEKKPTCVSALS